MTGDGSAGLVAGVTAVDELIRLIRTNGLAGDLLAKHRADASGRCPVRSSGGNGSGKVLAPCSLFRAAEVALGHAARSFGGGPGAGARG